MNRTDSTAMIDQETRWIRPAPGNPGSGDWASDFWLSAQIDSEWVRRKLAADYDAGVVEKLKKAVYAIGQGGRRWFSGGVEGVYVHQASTILDYLVLVELLLETRSELRRFQDEFLDCRDQLLMHISRHTEAQPDRVTELVEVVVSRARRQLTSAALTSRD